MTKEIITKVNEELKVQGINATEEQIKSAINEVMSKQELTEDALDNVAGGGGVNPLKVVEKIPKVIDTVKKLLGGKNEEKKDGGGKNNSTPGVVQTNTNTKTNQQNNVNAPNTMQNNTVNFG